MSHISLSLTWYERRARIHGFLTSSLPLLKGPECRHNAMLIYLILMYNGLHLRSRGTDIVRIEGTNGPQQRGKVLIYTENQCECKVKFNWN